MGRCLGLGCAVDEVVGDCGGRGVEVGTDGGGGLGGLGGPREHARLTASEAGWLVVLKGIVRMAVPVVVPLATPRPHKDAHGAMEVVVRLVKLPLPLAHLGGDFIDRTSS